MKFLITTTYRRWKKISVMVQSSPVLRVQEFSQFLSDFFNAFPDWRAKIEHIIAENNLVVVFLNRSGTHKGKFRGVEPTDREVNIRF